MNDVSQSTNVTFMELIDSCRSLEVQQVQTQDPGLALLTPEPLKRSRSVGYEDLHPGPWVQSRFELGSRGSRTELRPVYGVLVRECHRFINPCGLRPQVCAGMGTGWNVVTLAQPIPITQVDHMTT